MLPFCSFLSNQNRALQAGVSPMPPNGSFILLILLLGNQSSLTCALLMGRFQIAWVSGWG